MHWLISIFLILISSISSWSQEMRIGVLRDYNLKRINFSYEQESYSIYGDTTYLGSILPNEFVDCIANGSKVNLKIGTLEKGSFKTIVLKENQPEGVLTLQAKSPIAKIRKYEDNFEISCSNGFLTVVNLVDMDNYLAGVIESEGGGGQHLEYYKVQALMSRTYALKYSKRHDKEGFGLCDRVHCQAYHNMLRYTPRIDTAVRATSFVVMLDDRKQLVDAYFHANCGGETSQASYIWNNDIDYLIPFIDTFCIHTKQANWEKRIDRTEWENFLVRKYQYPIGDSTMNSLLYTFDQGQRLAFYVHPYFGIPLRDLRHHFHLKSTFFSTKLEGDQVVLSGRGFGHGVGLCQEGAMKMAKQGFSYDQIARFYFHGVQLEMRSPFNP